MVTIRRVGGEDSPLRTTYPPNLPPAAVAMLISQVQKMVEESGDPDGFDVRSWLVDWLHSPVPALGGKCPADYLHTPEGIDLISRLLASAQTGVYW
ncbi:DUF2384 domain-containing protein [Burkholderia sp. Bp9125]|nr:DUF2384 domain-containing protein [Burkholderia sp. Bp9125]